MIRKRLTHIIIFVLITILSACGGEERAGQNATTLSTNPVVGTAATETISKLDTKSLADALSEYEKENSILYTFPDALVSFRFLMLSEDAVHQVTFVSEITQSVLIPRDKISRIDQTDLGDLVSITITDTSGKTITDTLSKDDAKALLNELQAE